MTTPQRVAPERIIPATESGPGQQVGVALYWVRIDSIGKEIFLEDGKAVFFAEADGVDAAWAFVDGSGPGRPGAIIMPDVVGLKD